MSKEKNYQTTEPCTACGDYIAQRCLHHVKSQGYGGSDDKRNLMPLCLSHHNEVHSAGLKRFSDKHTNVKAWLEKNDWEYMEHFQRWINTEI